MKIRKLKKAVRRRLLVVRVVRVSRETYDLIREQSREQGVPPGVVIDTMTAFVKEYTPRAHPSGNG